MKNILAKTWELQIINGFRYSIARQHATPTATPTPTITPTLTATVTPTASVTPTPN